ncbi:MAG: AAA family ATPase [Oscillospiraceae bacterium]|jgi:SpoVK/Ycf46/Vps4 family AAA+-type ATPase|nr:AAA family ATPase [Oscillospiraceae bacterium]
MSKYSEQLHVTYQKAILSFVQAYPANDKDLSKQIDAFSRSNALYFWYSFSTNADACTEAINEIYTKETERVEYTARDVNEAMAFLSEHNVTMRVPDFFVDMIEYDVKNKTVFCRKFAEGMKLIYLTFVLIDDAVTFEEARMVSRCYQVLIDACDSKGINPYKFDVDPYEYVTASSSNDVAPKSYDIRKSSGKIAGKEENALDALHDLIGLKAAKKEIDDIINFARVQEIRKKRGYPPAPMSYHLVFTGNPGTGKTTVARLVAQIYKGIGVLSKGQLVEAESNDLVAGYVGQTAIKTHELVKKAIGGVLFIDEAYTLADGNDQGYGQETIDTLLKDMEDNRNDLAVIVAGYDERMQKFIDSNPGLKSRFNHYIHFEDYTAHELCMIFESLCDKNKYTETAGAKDKVNACFEYKVSHHLNDGNGRDVRNFFEATILRQSNRIAKNIDDGVENVTEITAEDIDWNEANTEASIEEAIKELKALTGLQNVKKEIEDLLQVVRLQKVRKEQGLKVPALSLHLVFTGNPGTGKTTVARCVAKIYKALGLLSSGQLIETDRSGLVAGYVGQTAIKTSEVINKAIGGVLFIDEAYTLSGGGENDFGQEAIDTLLKAMEDHRDNLVVIVAGYDDLMTKFINSNPGLASRFNRYIHFDDYNTEELSDIFGRLCTNNQYYLSDEAKTALNTYFQTVSAASIGNGRGVRNIFEKTVTQQAKRLSAAGYSDAKAISTIEKDDILSAVAEERTI